MRPLHFREGLGWALTGAGPKGSGPPLSLAAASLRLATAPRRFHAIATASGGSSPATSHWPGGPLPRPSPKPRESRFNFGGGEGIRTPGTLPYGGFQNRCLRPLGHSSERGLPSGFRGRWRVGIEPNPLPSRNSLGHAGPRWASLGLAGPRPRPRRSGLRLEDGSGQRSRRSTRDAGLEATLPTERWRGGQRSNQGRGLRGCEGRGAPVTPERRRRCRPS